jgi:hypothetical protein
MVTVGLAVLLGGLELIVDEDASLLVMTLPVLVSGLATFLPLSTFGNLVAGWVAAGFLVVFVIVTMGSVGGYFVPSTVSMLAAAVSITPHAPFVLLLEQLGARVRSRLREP